MSIDRLIAGVAAAALMAGAASAQTSGSTSTSASPNASGAMQGYSASGQPYATPPVTGGAAQPSATGQSTMTPSGGAMSGGAMSGAAMSGGAMSGSMQAPGQAPGTGMANSGAMGAGTVVLRAVPGANIVATLQASGQFTKLLAGLKATNLTTLISTHPALTLFAPTDTAFAALPLGQLDQLLKSPAQLQAILTYHLVATSIPEADLKGHAAGKVSAADNKQLTLDGSGPSIKVNDATALQPPVTASNGLIYPIDKVLTPPA